MEASLRIVALLSTAAFALLAGQASAAIPETSESRELYQSALADLRAGRLASFQQAQHELRDYALYPYLQFEDLRRRMHQLNAADVEAFRGRWPDTPLAERLHALWLTELIRRNDWQAYRASYEPSNHAERHCHYLRALYRTGDREAALAQAPELWLSGRSQPKACDPVFDALIKADGITSEMAWTRLMLALDARNPNLARYVRRFVDAGHAGLADRAFQLYRRAELIADTDAFGSDIEPVRDLVVRGIRWLARTDPVQAEALWQHYRGALSFADDEARALEQDLWIRLAQANVISRNADLRATADGRHEQVAEALLMASVRQQRWGSAVHWLHGLDEDDRRKPKWQYWLARAIAEDTADDPESQPDTASMLQEIARVRHYYGFLAAHRLGAEPNFNQRASSAHPMIVAQLAQRSAIQRITELHGIGDIVNARREWYFLYPLLSDVEQVAAVHLAAQIGWVDQTIHGANATELHDDLELRFPMPFQHVFEQESRRSSIPAGLLFGIARQESAFAPTARSSAGAVGLMQLMPATATEVATRLGIGNAHGSGLFDPELNVRLGSQYMAYLLQRYDGHRVHAAAAYNAGPSRVDRWVREHRGLPTDAWIESIPFNETRNYVKNVLAFSYIYSNRLGEAAPFLDPD
jgi:soluble lytic murein transglycosylase